MVHVEASDLGDTEMHFTFDLAVCHRVGMRTWRLIGAVLPTILLTGCLQSTALVKVNADGSGTIENQTLMTSAALAQMRQLAGLFGGTDGKPVDPFSEQQMRELAAQMGDGVTLISTKPLKTDGAEGREAVYAFRDITKLRVSESPTAPGNTSIRAGGVSIGAGQGAITMDLARTAEGNVLLTLHTPADPLSGLIDQFGSATRRGTPMPPDQAAMMRQMLAGLRVALRVEPAGRLLRTNSPYVDGQTVTLFDIDVDGLLKDEAAFTRLQNAKTASEAAEALKNVPGVKLTLDREITIEFAP
jgi:hypothetical protein